MVLMTCCGERHADVVSSMNHECTGRKATTTTVAQAISFAVDEVQEFGTSDGAETLFLDLETDDQDPNTELRVTEVSAEMENAGNGLMSQFTVKTSDGQEWNVRVTPKA
jgi:hypothetical protein